LTRYRQTDCALVEINGQQFPQVTFEISIEPESPWLYICFVELFPRNVGAPTDTCKFLGSSGQGWDTEVFTNVSAHWRARVACLTPGTTQGGFGLALNRATCCFDAYFVDEKFNRFGHEVVCFDCDPAVPARRATWGTVKVLYR
jgi:hypothetical protein